MTDSGFSIISVSHGRLNCRQVIQYNIVNKVTEACISAAVDAKRKGTHLSLVIWKLCIGRWPSAKCYITSACSPKWETLSRAKDLHQPDPQLIEQPPTKAKPRWSPGTSRQEANPARSNRATRILPIVKNKDIVIFHIFLSLSPSLSLSMSISTSISRDSYIYIYISLYSYNLLKMKHLMK